MALSDMTDEEMARKHAKHMAAIEAIWAEQAKRRSGTIAGSVAMGMLHKAKAFHCDADVAAATFGDIPPPTTESGGR